MIPPSTPSLGSLTSATTSSSLPDRKPDRLSSLPTTRWSITHDLAHLVRSSSTASSTTSRSQPRSPTWNISSTTDPDTNDLPDDDNVQDRTIRHIDSLGHDVLLELQMTRAPGDKAPERSRKAKIYEFLSRSTSRSRSKSASRRSTPNSSVHPEPDPTASPAPTPNVDPHLTPTRHDRERGAKPATRSPSRPLSNTTSGTVSTITPANAPARAHTPRAHAPTPFTIPEYDPRMPPPPVPPKKKAKGSTLFGITLPGRSRPPTPKDEPSYVSSPPLSPVRGRSGWGSPMPNEGRREKDPPAKVEWLPQPGPSSKFVVAPQPRTVPPIHPILLRRTSEDNPVDPVPRIRSSPPKLDHRHEAVSEFVRPPSSVSSRSRDGRCSPLFGLRIFGGGTPSSRGHSVSRSSSHKGKERATEKEKPVVSVPILRTRTRSRDGPPPSPVVPISGMAPTTRKARHGSFDFERINSATSAGIAGIGAGNTDVKRSASQSRAERHVRSAPQPHTHAHSQSASGRARVDHHHTSRRHVSPVHTPHDPPPSAHSQSTATTATTPGTNTAGVLPQNGGTGSWGRKNRTTGWVRAGMHPPFAFESATSGSGASNGRASPANTSDGRGKSSFDSRKERERAASAEHRENERSRSRGEGRWEAREVELGLGLTWAPSKIKVREWRSEKDREPERERHMREGEREARERLREFGYVGAGGGHSATTGAHRKRDREVTGRYKDVLGEAGFEAFKKYVRRFDAEIIPLEGSAGLLMRVRRLLDTAPSPGVNEREKREMLDDLMRIVRETES